VIQQQEKDI
jgi:hypothetical protein